MTYLASLLAGIAVGVAYAMIGVRSPAPPIIALVGLLGIVLGETGTAMVKQHFARSTVQITSADKRPSGRDHHQEGP